MSSELDDVARSLFLGQIPNIWRKLAPDTLKSLGNWMLYFLKRFSQYTTWVSERASLLAAQGSAWTPSNPHPYPRLLLPLAALLSVADWVFWKWSLTLQAYLYFCPFSLSF